MWRFVVFGLLFTSCGIFRHYPRNGYLTMDINSEYSYEPDFKVIRLNGGETLSADEARYAPKRNFQDSVIIVHPLGISDTILLTLCYRGDYQSVTLQPNQVFQDSITAMEKRYEVRLAKITECMPYEITKTEGHSTTEQVVDKAAIYPGGATAMANDLRDHIRVPQIALDRGVSGKVYLKFLIDEKGMIKCAQIIKSLPECPECDWEAMLGLTYLKPFEPAMKDGKPVKSYYSLPIIFKVQ